MLMDSTDRSQELKHRYAMRIGYCELTGGEAPPAKFIAPLRGEELPRRAAIFLQLLPQVVLTPLALFHPTYEILY